MYSIPILCICNRHIMYNISLLSTCYISYLYSGTSDLTKSTCIYIFQEQLESQRDACVRTMSSGKLILLSQSASSDLSWQSISPLHRRCASMHCPFSHWNWDAEHMGQLSSSLWSSHSGNPSHLHAIGIQSISPVAQVNWSGEQVGGSGERENRSDLYTQPYPFQQSKSRTEFVKKRTYSFPRVLLWLH